MNFKILHTYKLITDSGNEIELTEREQKKIAKNGSAQVKRAIVKQEDGEFMVDIVCWNVANGVK